MSRIHYKKEKKWCAELSRAQSSITQIQIFKFVSQRWQPMFFNLCINSLAPVRFGWNFKTIFVIGGYGSFNYENVLRWFIANEPHWWKFDISSDYGLVPSDNKPLSEAMLTQIHVTKWCHQATRSYLLGTLQYGIVLIADLTQHRFQW